MLRVVLFAKVQLVQLVQLQQKLVLQPATSCFRHEVPAFSEVKILPLHFSNVSSRIDKRFWWLQWRNTQQCFVGAFGGWILVATDFLPKWNSFFAKGNSCAISMSFSRLVRDIVYIIYIYIVHKFRYTYADTLSLQKAVFQFFVVWKSECTMAKLFSYVKDRQQLGPWPFRSSFS